MPNWNETDQAFEPDDINAAAERETLLRFATKQPKPTPATQSRTLFHAEIADREFGNHLLQVNALQEWAKAKGYPLRTQPPLADFDFVQVEALLCAIERAATQGVTYDQAEMLVQADPELSQHRAADCAPVWLIGADAHRKWRCIFDAATAQGELDLLDFGSKLPVCKAASTTPQPEQEAPAQPQSMSVSDTSKGTPPALSVAQKAEVVSLYSRGRGESVNALSKQFQVSRPTIDRVLKQAGIKKK